MFEDLKPNYSIDEATDKINEILSKYGKTVRITFRAKDAEIIDSYLVEDKEIRHKVCEIIARTGVTKRTYENLAAEWQVHNVSYYAGYKRDHAKDVSLDFDKDPRKSVRLATEIFDSLDIE